MYSMLQNAHAQNVLLWNRAWLHVLVRNGIMLDLMASCSCLSHQLDSSQDTLIAPSHPSTMTSVSTTESINKIPETVLR